jgi:hypothetical protein
LNDSYHGNQDVSYEGFVLPLVPKLASMLKVIHSFVTSPGIALIGHVGERIDVGHIFMMRMVLAMVTATKAIRANRYEP